MIRTDVQLNLPDSLPDANRTNGSMTTTFDVRAVANLVLDMAAERRIELTNMALNKIVFFVHSDFLIEKQKPLVGAKIEAWQHGPVFREIYHEFKRWNDQPIIGRATKVDPETGDVVEARAEMGEDAPYIRNLVERYIEFSAAHLRAISHRPGGPWDAIWGHDGRANPGMSISNDIIIEHYSYGVRQ